MDITEASIMATSLMASHGLLDWSLRFDNAKTRSGQCRHDLRVISLSRPITAARSEATVRNTILHEIAHGIVGVGHGHGPVWLRKALEIGCTGERVSVRQEGDEAVAGAWSGICPFGHPHEKFRAPQQVVTCAACSPRFDPAYAITWTRHGRPVRMPSKYLQHTERLLVRYGRLVGV